MSRPGLRTWAVPPTDKSAFVLGFLFQVINMSSDPFASVEREQSSTLPPVATEGLFPLMASGPKEGIDYLSGFNLIYFICINNFC